MSDNGYLKTEQLLKPAERRYTEVEIPDWGKVRIQSLSAREEASYLADIQVAATNKNKRMLTKALIEMKAHLVVLCLVDEAGHRILRDDQVSDLLDQDAGIIDELHTACDDHCKIDRDELAELAKN